MSLEEEGDDNMDWMPLYLSTIAGMSTCIGAGIVFLLPKDDSTNTKISIPPSLMSFSLALAGSVMITVSFISILPECLIDDTTKKYVSFDIFLLRALFFGLGWGLYLGLRYIFQIPEPEDLLSSSVLLSSSDEQQQHQHQQTNPLISPNKQTNGLTAISEINGLSLDSNTNNNNNNNKNGDMEEGEIMTPFVSSLPEEQVRSRRNNHNSPPQTKKRIPTTTTTTTTFTTMSSGAADSSLTNPSVSDWTSGKDLQTKEQRNAWRVALLLFFSLLFHNFPEGLAVAASAMESQKLGITVTIGIMIHNIPEGIAIAIPCLAARPDQPWLSFFMASISGLAEPFGAFVALMFLRYGTSLAGNLENILALVAGIMIAVAVCELFPEATRHVKQRKWNHFATGTISGIIIMVITEWYT